MNSISKVLMCACVSLAANLSFAEGSANTPSPAKAAQPAAPSMTQKAMTMQECKDHMAMSKKDGMKKDDDMMKKDATCADMMKKGSMKKDDAMMK